MYVSWLDMDHRLPTCRYLCVGRLGVHDFLDHLGDVSGVQRGHLQIRLRMKSLIHNRFYDGVVLSVSFAIDIIDMWNGARTLDLGLDIIFWVVELSYAHT